MGRELETIESIPAGNVFGLGGVGHCVLKTGTISTVRACQPFQQMSFQAAPIVRVALEPGVYAPLRRRDHLARWFAQTQSQWRICRG